MTEYKNISTKLYDLTKPPGTSVDGDIEFYKEEIIPLNGKILEAGVGNGRMLIPLLKYGVDIEGVDNSNDMINICKNNLNKYGLESKLYKNELSDFFKSNYYEAIIMPNGSFCLLEEQNKILNNFYESLQVDGKLYLDLIYPTSFKVGTYSEYQYIDENNKIEISNYAKEINWSKQYTINEIKYNQILPEQDIETQNFKLYWYSEKEIEMMLEKANFKEIKFIKNYNQKRNLNFKTLTVIATKKTNS